MAEFILLFECARIFPIDPQVMRLSVIKRKDVFAKRFRNTIMAEKQKCEYCEKEAIGFQTFEGCFEFVCRDHAHKFLLELKPGEKKSIGVSVFERYS